MRRRIICLLRVSTDAQDLQRQRTDVNRVVSAHELDIIRTAELDGVSGRHVQADPQFQSLVRDLQRPDVAGIAISALDRLFRPEHYGDFAILDYFKAAGKLIFSAKEGVLDPATDAGFLMSLMSGAQAGMEWRELRRRTIGGKAEKRKLGRNVNGSAVLPRGLGYERITDAAGRTIDGRWFLEEPDASRVRLAYDLLFAGDSYQTIARKIGGGWSDKGVRDNLKNPCWMGIRRYPPDEQGMVLEIPLGFQLISSARWHAAQKIIAGRSTTWSKQTRESRFLAAGLLICECGRKYYSHSDKRRNQYDQYYCSSGFRGGQGCGSMRLRREAVDAAVEQILSRQLTDAAFLAAVLGKSIQAPSTDTSKREREMQKLAEKRERLIDLYAEGRLSKMEFNKRLDAVTAAVSEIEALMPAVAPMTPSVRHVIAGLARAFAPSRFGKLPFEERRATLRRVIRTIPVVDGSVPGFTFSGAFLTECSHTNLGPRSTALSEIGVCADLPIMLPTPIKIAA